MNFDISLRQRDASWGIRDVSDLAKLAQLHGIALRSKTAMPANNFVLHWEKQKKIVQ